MKRKDICNYNYDSEDKNVATILMVPDEYVFDVKWKGVETVKAAPHAKFVTLSIPRKCPYFKIVTSRYGYIWDIKVERGDNEELMKIYNSSSNITEEEAFEEAINYVNFMFMPPRKRYKVLLKKNR